MRKLRLLSAAPVVATVLVVGGATGASAAPPSGGVPSAGGPAAGASCVAQATDQLGAPGLHELGGGIVSFVARAPHGSCPFSGA